MDIETDIVVIGSGPGGEGAAMKASKCGRDVVMVDQQIPVGGNCTHQGTIPSKALRQVVREAVAFKKSRFGRNMSHVTFHQLRQHAQSVMEKQARVRGDFYARNDVPVVKGHARFADPHTMVIEQDNGGQQTVRFQHAIIAAGSRPYRPDDLDFSHPAIRDSDTILHLDETPSAITIFGAGVIGCEYACIFRNMGVKVNLVNTRERLLTFLDEEITDALAYHLRDQGVLIRNNEQFSHCTFDGNRVVTHLESGKQLKSDLLLWAAGRSGNTNDLGLENLSIEATKRGSIAVDQHYRIPGCEHVYAVGDITGWPNLASAAYDQGRFAASHLCEGIEDLSLVEHVPAGIYTIPEISSLGATEQELTKQQVPYEVGQSLFRSLARAHIANEAIGMLKLLFHRDTKEILGIHCFGHQASEIIHIGQAAMILGANMDYFINTTFNYPTMAEAYRVAALNGLNRL